MDYRFGRILMWSKKNGEDLLIMKRRESSTAEDCVKNIQHARERLMINQEYLMHMMDFSVKVVSQEHYEVWGFYQAPLHDLKKEIENRSKDRRLILYSYSFNLG